MTLPTSITLCLNVRVVEDDTGGQVYLEHSSLGHFLCLSFSSMELAEIQLNAIRLDKDKTTLESVLDDTASLMELSGKLKDAIRELRKA